MQRVFIMFESSCNEKRITKLEIQFNGFQDKVGSYVDSERLTITELKENIRDIFALINTNEKDKDVSLKTVEKDIMAQIEKHYHDKTELLEHCAESRTRILHEVSCLRKQATKELFMWFSGLTAALLVCGWLYTSGIVHDRHWVTKIEKVKR